MRKWTMGFVIPFILAFMGTGFSQSLADLAEKEKERRQDVKQEKVITSEELAKFRSETATPEAVPDKPASTGEQEPKASEEQKANKSEKPESDEPVDLEGRTESYWRKTMGDARQKVKDLEREENVLVLRLNGLQTDFYREDNGFKRESIQREIQKTIYEQDKNKEELAKARSMLQQLEKEARSSGALPGWID